MVTVDVVVADDIVLLPVLTQTILRRRAIPLRVYKARYYLKGNSNNAELRDVEMVLVAVVVVVVWVSVSVMVLADAVLVVVVGWSRSQSATVALAPRCHGNAILGVPMHLGRC